MIQIIGAGAIGCLWLAKLLQAKQTCHIVSRSAFISSKLHLTHLTGEEQQFTISHSHRLLNTKESEQNSTILVCVKAPQVLNALLMQQEYISSKQVIILMHNGYGCAEEVRQHFPNNPIVCATTANASLFKKTENPKIESPLCVTETGRGPSFFGAFNTVDFKSHNKDLSKVILPFQKAMQDVYWSEDIIEKCWLKLAINAAINPLTAIKQIQNGQLQDEQYMALINKILEEVTCIANAEKILLTMPFLQKTVSDVIQATAENFSSMNRDIFYKRPTEIDYINGYLLNKAKSHKIKAPILSDLYAQIKALEHH